MEPTRPPYAPPGPPTGPPAERRPRRLAVWLLVGLGLGMGLAVVLSCGGLGVLAFRFGIGLFVEQVRADLRGNPVVREHVGEIHRFEMDWLGSAMAPGDDVFVFRVEGSLGSGRITATCVTIDAEREQVTAGRLRLDSGAEHDLFPDGPPPRPDP